METAREWPNQYKWPLIIFFTIGFGVLYLNVIDLIPNLLNLQPLTPKPQWAIDLRPILILFVYSSAFYIGLWPSFYIVDKILELYPSVEFTMGPEYLHIEERRRHKLYQFIIIGVVPLILSLLIELLKYLY